MKVGVFFGSFNPIHLGHVAIAERFLQEEDIDEVWLSVSPHNPLKEKSGLLPTHLRVEMAQLAIPTNVNIKVVDFEKNMPQPSYTYEALLELKTQFAEHDFVLLIGGDNCGLFNKWRNYDKIIRDFAVYAYPRDKADVSAEMIDKLNIIEAPLLDYASTDIRHSIAGGMRPQGLNAEVLEYITVNKLYQE